MNFGRDQFGFKVGTKKSRAAQLYLEGATNDDIKYELDGSQMNLLFEVSELGHQIKMGTTLNRGTKKTNTVYTIKFDENVTPVNFRKLSIERMKKLGFKQHQILDDFITIWLVPFHLKKAIPEGFKLHKKVNGSIIKMDHPVKPGHKDLFVNGPNGCMYVGILPTDFSEN